MTQPEYEQKKRECWEDFCRHIVDEEEEFYNMFDRAYSLGKEKEIISQYEIDEAAEDYVSFKKSGECILSYIVKRACRRAFKDGANFALGKQENDMEGTVIQGWVCRDKKDNVLYLHVEKPYLLLDKSLFPNLTWESDPIEVELIIKRKKK